MAIYIQIRKTDEDQSGATYEFGPSEGIIGTVFESEATSASYSLAVASVIHRDHVELALQCFVRPKPIQRGICGPSVQKQQRGSAERARCFADPCCSAAG
jgi:hypothetical protein